MPKKILVTLLVGFMTHISGSPARAFHGGGGGFHGGGGGFHGGGFGGFRGAGYGGFHGGGYGGGYGGFHGYSAPAFNRTPSLSMPRTISPTSRSEFGNANRFNSMNAGNRFNALNAGNRFGNVNNLNRVNAGNNVNRFNNFNNVNVNRVGAGWHNPYMGYHQGWVHGYWNGHYPGGWGWRGYGYGYPGYWGGFGGGLGWGLGMGMGWGLSSWLFGPMLYNWGYSNYYNPYYGGYGYAANTVVAQPAAYDYSQPINATTPPPDHSVANQAMTVFDSAREAFRGGDYAKALELVDQALKSMPNDATLHEFRALVLFALKRYDEAAGVLYAVLSVGPGWDWTTLISLYADPETYTQQLRALESYCGQSPESAAGRFVLGYHYLTQGHADAAVRQFKIVATLQPKDQLSAQLIQQLTQTDQTAAAAGALAGQPSTAARGGRCGPRPRRQCRNAERLLDGPAQCRHDDHSGISGSRPFHLEGDPARQGSAV